MIGRRDYAGIFLLCFGTLLLELSLTRVMSVGLWYHFGFLVISTALLGFGASGVTLALFTRPENQIVRLFATGREGARGARDQGLRKTLLRLWRQTQCGCEQRPFQ